MAITLRATVASNMINYQKERLLVGFHNQMVASQFAQRSSGVPTNKGDTVEWHFKMKLARLSSALSENTDITPKAMYMSSKTATAEEWGDAVQKTRRLDLTTKHLGGWNEMTDSLATGMAESLDYQMLTTLAGGGYRVRADADATYTVDCAATSDGSTTTFISTTLTESDDAWNGGYITITSPDTSDYADRANYCETRLISDFVASTDTVTHAAFAYATQSGCTAHLCVGTGVAAGDVLSTAVVGLFVRTLKRNKGVRFNDGLVTKGMMNHKETSNLPPGSGGPGYWVGLLSQEHEYDFMKDTTWVSAGTSVKTDWLVNGEMDKWMGTKFYGTTQAWREDVDGTENEATGVVQLVHFLAQDAYGLSPISAPGAEGDFGVVVNLKRPEDYGDVGLIKSSIAAQAFFARRSLNSLWNVTGLCGATA